jgi:DedD protein
VEQRLKERLIGTAVITALAVIFLPMLIDDSDQRWVQQEAVVDVPPLPDRFKTKPKILTDAGVDDVHLFPTRQAVGSGVNPAAISIADSKPESQTNGVKTTAPVLKTPPVLKKAPVVKKVAPSIEKQLESLLPAGNKTINQAVTKPSVPAIKPKPIQQAKPVVAKIKPVPVKPRTQLASKKTAPKLQAANKVKVPATDLTGLWIIQAGVFKDKANAETLRSKLSENGFSTYLESVNTELGELIRVRVGRVPEEQTARQMAATINKRFSLKSIAFPETDRNSKRARQ